MVQAKPYPTPMYENEVDEDAAREAAEKQEKTATEPPEEPIEMEPQMGQVEKPRLSTIAQEVSPREIMEMPAVTSGKLFFFQDGKARACSANLVGKPDVIVTAGHCVFADGHRSRDITFVPLYGHSLGAFSAKKGYTHSRWTADQSRNYDWAVIELESPVLTTGAGRLRYVVNHAPNPDLEVTAYGYPADAPFDGHELFKVVGNALMTRLLPHVYMRQNDMTPGASGGAWVKDGKLVGLNAWRVRSKENYVYSPKLETDFCSALNEAGATCS